MKKVAVYVSPIIHIPVKERVMMARHIHAQFVLHNLSRQNKTEKLIILKSFFLDSNDQIENEIAFISCDSANWEEKKDLVRGWLISHFCNCWIRFLKSRTGLDERRIPVRINSFIALKIPL